MHTGAEDRVQIALGEVRAGVADLIGAPPVPESPRDLAGRADVQPDPRAALAQEPEHVRLALSLQREPDDPAEAGAGERLAERARLLLDPREVVHVCGRATRRGDVLGVAARHNEPPAADLQPWARPPRP